MFAVFLHLLGKIIDQSITAVDRGDTIVTLHQFLFYFKDRGKNDLDRIIVEAAVDCKILIIFFVMVIGAWVFFN